MKADKTKKNNRPKRVTLNAKLLTVQLGSLCMALLVFFIFMVIGQNALERFYLSEEAGLRREMRYIYDLNDYVQQYGLCSTDADDLSAWAKKQKYVYLVIYKGEETVLETNGDSVQTGSIGSVTNLVPPEGGTALLTPDEDGCYAIAFADGVFRVSLTEYSETPLYNMVTMLALAAACLVLLSVNLQYNRSLTRSIIRLNREVQWVEEGSRDAVIHTDHQDELGDLARAVERMRRAIIQRMQGEQEAWKANSSLITAISHDIRTPLTALIGYLDLLEGKQYQNEEQMERYLRASRDRALQLKELTEELFRYFLVFGQAEMKPKMEEYDAVILLEQLLGEHVVRLRSQEYTVQTFMLEEPCTISVDVQYLRRAFDNLFSNVVKHGDKSRPVVVMARLDGDTLRVDIANDVPARPNAAESTRIGLQTVDKILRQMGGSFEVRRDEKRFLTEIALPAKRTEQEGET